MHALHKRDTFVKCGNSREGDLEYYSPFTMWSLQKNKAIMKKPPPPTIYKKQKCHGGGVAIAENSPPFG